MRGGRILSRLPRYAPQQSQPQARPRTWRFLRDMPGCQFVYDPSRRAPSHIEADLRRYDPAVVLRFNQGLTDSNDRVLVKRRWEVWRFKGAVVPRDLTRVTPEEWCRRATFCFELEDHKLGCKRSVDKACTCGGMFVDVDARVRRALWFGDLFRRLNVTPDKLRKALAKHLDEQDDQRDADTQKRLAQATADWASDDARFIDEARGSSRPIFVMGKR